MEHLGHLLPVHGYKVTLSYSLTTDYLPSLIHLYQPLIGRDAISLYLTLLEEKNIQEEEVFTHHMLMSQLNMPLNEIYEARKKLEAIGLLQTYKKELEETLCYRYELQPPFRPQYFFEDMMLSELLFRQIGESKFERLKQYYTKQAQVENLGENITASFKDVFETVVPKDNDIERNDVQEENLIQKEVSDEVDFSFLEESLRKNMMNPNKILTKRNKQIIVQLMTLYNLPLFEVEKAIQWALTEDHHIDVEQLKQACHDLFRQKYGVSQPKLNVKQKIKPKETLLDENEPNITDEERLIRRFEKISPKELLEDLSRGKRADEKDLELIRDIMTNQGLEPAVMNVLIHYVMLQSNMRLPANYTRKIASHWSRLNFQTAREAMKFAKESNQKQSKQPYKQIHYKNSKEVIPEWFKERKEKDAKENKHNEEKKKQVYDDKEQEAMLAMLRQHSNK